MERTAEEQRERDAEARRWRSARRQVWTLTRITYPSCVYYTEGGLNEHGVHADMEGPQRSAPGGLAQADEGRGG